MVIHTESSNPDSPYFLEFDNGKKFLMQCSPGNKVTNDQTIAELCETTYQTPTGGFLKYSDTDKFKLTKNKRGYEVIEDLIIYWVPEETHEINKDSSLLIVNHGDFLTEKCELISDVWNLNPGFVEIYQENGIVKEITLKPGFLKEIRNDLFDSFQPKIFGIGEEVCTDFKTEQVVFVEQVETKHGKFLLIRPVIEYYIKKDNFKLDQILTNDVNTIIKINVSRRLLYKSGEKVKSVGPV